jgi:hypothetical protein
VRWPHPQRLVWYLMRRESGEDGIWEDQHPGVGAARPTGKRPNAELMHSPPTIEELQTQLEYRIRQAAAPTNQQVI